MFRSPRAGVARAELVGSEKEPSHWERDVLRPGEFREKGGPRIIALRAAKYALLNSPLRGIF